MERITIDRSQACWQEHQGLGQPQPEANKSPGRSGPFCARTSSPPAEDKAGLTIAAPLNGPRSVTVDCSRTVHAENRTSPPHRSSRSRRGRPRIVGRWRALVRGDDGVGWRGSCRGGSLAPRPAPARSWPAPAWSAPLRCAAPARKRRARLRAWLRSWSGAGRWWRGARLPSPPW